MEIVTFLPEHLESAHALCRINYAEACAQLPILPAHATPPELTYFAENGMGVVALEDGDLLGYLGGVRPFDGLFGPVRGTFSPLHSHASIAEQRAHIYSRLYQGAAERWLAEGATSHAIVLYAQDDAAVHSFFFNGFGLRTLDAIRRVEPLAPTPRVTVDGVTCGELPADQLHQILPLHNGLTTHLRHSPIHMPVGDYDEGTLLAGFAEKQSRLFVAWHGGRVIAYIELMGEGENFVTLVPEMPNICGAYMLPEYRGSGIYAALLDHLLGVLAGEGYTWLGVDFEGFNPTATGFWLKHFTAYTYGVTRRIDERVLIS